jgi:hypothetical protein
VDSVDAPDDVLDNRADVSRPDEHGPGLRERLSAPAGQLRVSAHRVLELGAMRLDCERNATCDPDRSPRQNVVREHELGR